MAITQIITKFTDGIFDDLDLIIDLKFDSEPLTDLSGEPGAFIETPLVYTIADGDMGITMVEDSDIEDEEIIIYRSVTEDSLNFTPLGEDGDPNTILIEIDNNENNKLTERFGTPSVTEHNRVDVEDFLEDVFTTCYESALKNHVANLLSASPPATYTSKKIKTRQFDADEMQQIQDVRQSTEGVGTTTAATAIPSMGPEGGY